MSILAVTPTYLANLIIQMEICHGNLVDCMCDNLTLGYPIADDLKKAKSLSNAIFYAKRADLSDTDEAGILQKVKEDASEVCTINEYDLFDPAVVDALLYEDNTIILLENGTEYLQEEE